MLGFRRIENVYIFSKAKSLLYIEPYICDLVTLDSDSMVISPYRSMTNSILRVRRIKELI